MKRVAVLLLALTVALGLVATPTPASARGCSVTWGSTAKTAGPSTSPGSPVQNVRTGRHPCYDRFVVDLGGPASGFAVRYVNRYRAEGSGNVIPLPGGGKLEIIVRAPGEGFGGTVGQPLPGVTVAGYETFRSTRFGGSFEGQTSFGLGVRARLPFRVMKVANRVVIDVAHHW